MKPSLTFNETHSVFVFFSYRVSRTFALLGILIIIQRSGEDIVFNNGALVKAHSIRFLPTVVKIYVGQRLQQWPSGSRQWKRLSRRVNIKPFASHPHTRMQFPDALITTSLIWMLSSILWAISEKYNNFLITYVAGKIWGVGFPRNNYKGTH